MTLKSELVLRLGVSPRSHLSPLLEKCCRSVCANESYQNAEADLSLLLGIEVAHSSLHRCVQRQDFSLPEALPTIETVSLDGGKVRLRSPDKGQPSYWRDYKAARLNDHLFGACFQDNLKKRAIGSMPNP